jgi:hypothetical protein
MTPLRDQARLHEADADYHAENIATWSGEAQYCREHGQTEQARELEIMISAAQRCEERALFRAVCCRRAADDLEHAENRFTALSEVAA